MATAQAKKRQKSSASARERGGIQSVERAAAILEAVAGRRDGIGLGGLSAETGLHTSTAFHLIKTLTRLGFLVQDSENKRYRIGSRIFGLAAGARDENMLLGLGTPLLERLSSKTGEAAHLAIRLKQDIIVIARTEASGLLQLAGRPGATRPAHATAIGKILLAAMTPDDFDRLLTDLPLPRLTTRTITEEGALRRHIEEVRHEGIAYDNRELDDDVCCAAVPVRDFSGRCIAAIGISGPAWRLSRDAMEEKTQDLRNVATELSLALGYKV